VRDSPFIVCYVTDGRGLAGGAGELPGVIRAAARAGVDWVQIREKQLPARQLAELARTAVQEARTAAARAMRPEQPARVLVNDRLDVALAAGAGGVHLGGDSLPVNEVRAWLERERERLGLAVDFLIGRSCHAAGEAQQAERDGASYVIFGPVFATPSKERFGPPQGLERLREVCGTLRIPVLAIGGITLENAAACRAAGAAGVAAIRLFQQAEDLAETVARLRSAG